MKNLILFLALVAFSTGAWCADFAQFGLTEQGQRTEDGVAYTVLIDANGAEILFRSFEEPSAERISAMATIAASLRSWKSLDIAALRAVNETDRLQLIVVPRRFEYSDTDLLTAVPGGLIFYFVSSPEYDFRVRSGEYVIRLRGLLTSEEDVLGSVVMAFKDPVGFLAARDPQYAIRRSTELSALVTKLQQSLEQEGASTKELQAASAKRLEVLETALMATMNKGFFGGPKSIDPASIAKLVELKAATPALTRIDAATALKAAGVTMSAKEIDIVFQVKFGER